MDNLKNQNAKINLYKNNINKLINEYKKIKSSNENKSKKKNNRQKITDLFAEINWIQYDKPPEIKNKLKEYSRSKRKEILSNFEQKYPINNHISKNFDFDNFRKGMQIALEGVRLYDQAIQENVNLRKKLYNGALKLFEESYKTYNNPVACVYISHYYSERIREDFLNNKQIYSSSTVKIKSWAKNINSNIAKNEEISKKYLIKAMQILKTIPNKNNLFNSFGINYNNFSKRIKEELYFVHYISEGTYSNFQLNI